MPLLRASPVVSVMLVSSIGPVLPRIPSSPPVMPSSELGAVGELLGVVGMVAGIVVGAELGWVVGAVVAFVGADVSVGAVLRHAARDRTSASTRAHKVIFLMRILLFLFVTPLLSPKSPEILWKLMFEVWLCLFVM